MRCRYKIENLYNYVPIRRLRTAIDSIDCKSHRCTEYKDELIQLQFRRARIFIVA